VGGEQPFDAGAQVCVRAARISQERRPVGGRLFGGGEE
jgi:hypothetical protein